MDKYILIRTDGKYAARSGMKHSYTRRLEYARVFSTRESAERERCENETIRRVLDIVGSGE